MQKFINSNYLLCTLVISIQLGLQFNEYVKCICTALQQASLKEKNECNGWVLSWLCTRRVQSHWTR